MKWILCNLTWQTWKCLAISDRKWSEWTTNPPAPQASLSCLGHRPSKPRRLDRNPVAPFKTGKPMNKPEKSLDDAIARLPKWAQEAVQERIDEAELWASFRPTEDVSRDLPPPKSSGNDRLTMGWSVNVYRAMNDSHDPVYRACSSSISHGEGWEGTGAQRPIHLFSSRLLALKSCRRAVERKTAAILWSLDKQIAEEIADPTHGPLNAVQ